ncbi:oligosaccharide flippase family protein (plasmid) [Nostoc sp. UHCC 0302]|uniref:oligosaccharide flippase family protein n=1 Tax=Nostoc sp. UHCC 0302 TaxID=3134896 RepID=UPI00311C9A39
MSTKQKLVVNSISMLLSRLVQSIASFILSAAIARILGAEELGKYLLAFSYYYIFMSIVSQGLKTFFIRELSRKELDTSVYLVNGTLLQFIFAIIGYIVLVVIVFLLPYNDDTSNICYIMGLTIIPFSLSNITEAVFTSQEKMHIIAILTIPVYILRVLVMIRAMQLNYNTVHLAGVMFISEALIFVFEWFLLTRTVKLKLQINRNFIEHILQAARTFLLIEGIGAFSNRIEILILSLLGNEFLIGLFGGITQLMQPFLLIANSVAIAFFPAMSKTLESGREKQRQITEVFIEMLMIIALPFLVGLLFMGQDLLIFVYDLRFIEATLALKVTALTLILSPFNRSLSYLLVANDLERINLREVICTTILGCLLGAFLVSQYKLLGAAIMWLLMSLSAFSQFMYTVYNRLFSLNLWRIIRRPLLVSSLIMLVLIILEKMDISFLVKLVVLTLAYCLFVSVVIINIFVKDKNIWRSFLKKYGNSFKYLVFFRKNK